MLPNDDTRVAVVAVPPTVEAVSHAGRQLASQKSESGTPETRWLVYPDPVADPDLLEALEALAAKFDVRLSTPGQILKESRL